MQEEEDKHQKEIEEMDFTYEELQDLDTVKKDEYM